MSTKSTDAASRPIHRHSDAHYLDRTDCPNCGASLVGAFCHHCGQAAHLHRDVTGFMHDVLHGVFHFDGKFWTTLPLLTFRPGTLTRRYIDGERAKFVTPMAMFLCSVFLMFVVVGNVPGWRTTSTEAEANVQVGNARVNIDRLLMAERARLARLDGERLRLSDRQQSTASINARMAEALGSVRKLEAARSDLADMDLRAADGDLRPSPDADTPARDEKDDDRAGASPGKSDARIVGNPWIDEKIEKARANPKLLFLKMKSNGYKYSWMLIPMSLPFLWLMFAWSRRFGLYDHAVFATYSIAFMSLLIVLLTLIGWALGAFGQTVAWIAMFTVPPIHMYKQLRNGYELRRFSATWRTIVLLQIVSLTSLSFFLILLSFGLAD